MKAICVYCTIMHVSILVDFAIVTYFLFYKRDVTLAGGPPSLPGGDPPQAPVPAPEPAPRLP